MNIIFAQNPPPSIFPTLSWLVLGCAILAILVAVGVYVSKKLMEITKNQENQTVSHSMLTEIKQAYAAGEISTEEYSRIRARLISVIRNETLGENEKAVIFVEKEEILDKRI